MRPGSTLFAFGLVGAILISAAHDHMLGWGTAVAVVATLHNIWRQVQVKRAEGRSVAVEVPVPERVAALLAERPTWPEHWPAEWHPTFMGRQLVREEAA